MAPVLSFLVSDLVWCTDRGSSVVLALLAYLRGHFNKPLIGFKGQCESLGFVWGRLPNTKLITFVHNFVALMSLFRLCEGSLHSVRQWIVLGAYMVRFLCGRVFSALDSVCCAIAYWLVAIEGLCSLCSLLLIVYGGYEQSRVWFFVSLDGPGDTDSCWNVVMHLISIKDGNQVLTFFGWSWNEIIQLYSISRELENMEVGTLRAKWLIVGLGYLLGHTYLQDFFSSNLGLVRNSNIR